MALCTQIESDAVELSHSSGRRPFEAELMESRERKRKRKHNGTRIMRQRIEGSKLNSFLCVCQSLVPNLLAFSEANRLE